MRRKVLTILIMLFLAFLLIQSLAHWRAEALFPSTISALPQNPAKIPSLEKQIALLQRCIALQPRNADYRLLLAERLLLRSSQSNRSPDLTQRDLERASDEIGKALRLKPADPRCRILLGQYLMQKGQTEQALARLRSAIALAPYKGQVHAYLAMALARAQAEDPERRAAWIGEGRIAFRRALELDPPLGHNLALLSSLADLHLAAGEREEALRALQRIAALPIQMEALPSLYKLASLHLYQGEAAKSVKIYRDLLGRQDLAWNRPFLESEIRRAGIFYPQAWQVHQLLAELYFNKGIWPEAIRHYRQWASLRPTSPEAHFHLGLTYDKMGQKILALAQYEVTLRLAPRHPGATQKLIEYYRR